MFEKEIPYQLIKANFTGFPRMVRVKQRFQDTCIADIEKEVFAQIQKLPLPDDLASKRIAITAGSRGIPNFRETITAIGRALKKRGAIPFVVPAMGSHGCGTAEGQTEVLATYGMTEETLEMPIVSSMETVLLGISESGAKVYCDKTAYEADGIVVCGRVKPHTDFRAPIESGLCKMMVVGLGNHQGAVSFHKTGEGDMGTRLQNAARLFLSKTKVLFAMALIDNAYHKTKRLEAVMPENILVREPELLIEAAQSMSRLLLHDIDTLVVDCFGKEISGAGMDPNITGRFLFAPHLRDPNYPHVKKIAVLRLTEASHGNAAGLGIIDYVSRKFAQALDLGVTYTNSLSSTLSLGKIPMVMNNDVDTIYAAASACGKGEIKDVRIVRIENTLELEHILVSENLLPEITERTDMELMGEPEEIAFDGQATWAICPDRPSVALRFLKSSAKKGLCENEDFHSSFFRPG